MHKLTKIKEISRLILEIRGKRIMLDKDLAAIYGVSTKRLKEQVKRNLDRFPDDFMFRLAREELDTLRSQFATLDKFSQKFIYLPYAFTRNGANMLSAILKSPAAIQRSIQIMRAFSTIEESVGTRKKHKIYSPKIRKQLSVHAKAILHLFQDSRLKNLKISKIYKIQEKMASSLQQIIIGSLKEEEETE